MRTGPIDKGSGDFLKLNSGRSQADAHIGTGSTPAKKVARGRRGRVRANPRLCDGERAITIVATHWPSGIGEFLMRISRGEVGALDPQDHTGLIEKGWTAADWLHQFAPDASRQEIHGLLGQMLFQGEEGLKPTEALSGGETARLLFCKIMLLKPNVLVFDEPTNHLDLESINALNIALQKFEGTVLLVTHDQDLMEEVGTRVWHFAGGTIEDFKGTFEEFEAKTA